LDKLFSLPNNSFDLEIPIPAVPKPTADFFIKFLLEILIFLIIIFLQFLYLVLRFFFVYYQLTVCSVLISQPHIFSLLVTTPTESYNIFFKDEGEEHLRQHVNFSN
jgi:hypothetical protein